MGNEEKAVCFNCNGTGKVPNMKLIKDASEEELNDTSISCWIEYPECHSTGFC